MHEASIVASLFGILREKMNDLYGAQLPVTRIKVVVGKLSTVVPDALSFAFQMLQEGTQFKDAKIEIEYVPLKIKCKDCRNEMELDEPFLFCRICDSFNVEIISGKELYVESFDVNDDELPRRKSDGDKGK